MAQPTPYDPVHEFLTDEAVNPRFPGSELDIEFAAIRDTLDETLANLALIQRDDGELANGIVKWDSLSTAIQASLGDVGALEDLQALATAAAASATSASTSATSASASATTASNAAAAMRGTAADAVTIGTGSKSFTTQAGKSCTVGTWLNFFYTADPLKGFQGQVTAYNSVSGALTVNVTHTYGSGTFSDWTWAVSGAPGNPGVDDVFTGDSGSGGVAGLVPAPAAGDTAAGYVLLPSGVFGPVPGGGASRISFASYNPDNTGATDVTALLENAIFDLDAAGGGELFIPGGTYKLTGPISLPSNCVIVGDQSMTTILKVSASHSIDDNLFINDTIPSDNTTRTNTNIGFRWIKFLNADVTFPTYPNTDYDTITPLVRFSKVLRPFVIECEFSGWGNTNIQTDGCYGARILNNKITGAGTPYFISSAIRDQDSGSRVRIIGISQNNPAVLTVDSTVPGSLDSATVRIEDIAGMTQFATGNYTSGVISGSTLPIPAVDSTAFSAFLYNGRAIVGSSNWIRSYGTIIAGNEIRDGNRIGIEFGGTRTIVAYNIIDNMKESGLYGSRATSANVFGNIVTNINMSDISAGGFELTSVVDMKFHHNTIDTVQGSGGYVHSGKNIDISHNTIRNPFRSKGLNYPVNRGSVLAGIDGTPLSYQHKHGIKLTNNDEVLDNVQIHGNTFLSDLNVPNLLSAITGAFSSGASSIKNVRFYDNDLTGWVVVRGLAFSSVSNVPAAGDTLTGATSLATGVVLYYDSTAGEEYVVMRTVSGTFSPGENVNRGATLIGVARSWDFDANMMIPLTVNSVEQWLRYGTNMGHVTDAPVVKSYTTVGTGDKYFDFGFVPSLVLIEASNPTSTTLIEGSKAWIRNKRITSTQEIDQRTTVVSTGPAARQTPGGTSSIVALIDAGGVAVNTASFSAWTPTGFKVNWSLHSTAAVLTITAWP